MLRLLAYAQSMSISSMYEPPVSTYLKQYNLNSLKVLKDRISRLTV